MILISRFLPILRKPLAGWLVLTTVLATLITVTSFQEMVELPKIVVWYVGLGIGLLIFLYKNNTWRLYIPKSILWVIFILFITTTIGLLFSSDIQNSIFGVHPRYSSSYIIFVSWIISMLLFVSIEKDDLRSVLKFYALSAVAVAAWGILQAFGIGYYEGLNAPIRILAPSFLGNPNFSAMFIVTALPLLLWASANAQNLVKKYLYFLSIGILLVSLVLFNSRGAFVGMIVSLVIYMVMLALKKAWKQVAIIGLVVCVFASIAALFFYNTRVNVVDAQSNITGQTITSRLVLWDVTLDYIKANPLAGTGFGNFFLAFRTNDHSALANQEWFDDAHNIILQMGATTGVIPTALFIALFGITLYGLWKNYRSGERVGISTALAAAIIAWAVTASFTPVSIPNWIFLALLFATAWQLQNVLQIFEPFKLAKFGVIGTAVVFIFLGTAILTSEVFLWQARGSFEKNDYISANKYSHIALQVLPYNTNAYIMYLDTEMRLERYDNVARLADNFKAQHPSSSGVYQISSDYFSKLFIQTGDATYLKAMYEDVATMVLLNSNYATTYSIAALQMVYNDDYTEALPLAQRAVVLNGAQYNSWILLGKVQYELGNRQATHNALLEAYKISPQKRLKNVLKQFKSDAPLAQISFPYEFKR